MTTLLSISIILVFLLIIGIALSKPIFCIIRKHKDIKLRMWCIKQASLTDVCNYIESDSGTPYATEEAFVSLAEKYYLFLTEHTTYLSKEEKLVIFPEKYKNQRPTFREEGLIQSARLPNNIERSSS